MRLDVAEHVPLGFWREFRAYVRQLNPEFYLVGENWWTKWPDQLMDPLPWVKGDIFDAVMHYQWLKVAIAYFGNTDDKTSLSQFKTQLDSVFLKYPLATQQAMMNLVSSHDSPRILTSMFNTNKYKYYCKPQEDKNYKTNQPDVDTYNKTKLLLLHQFTFIGAPHIWNGDEMGMYGADDPDNRKPLLWDDIIFEKETNSSFSKYKYEETPVADKSMLDYYKALIKMRNDNKALSRGNYTLLDHGDDKNILIYERCFEGKKIWIIINNNFEENELNLPYQPKSTIFFFNTSIPKSANLVLAPFSGLVLEI
jgi:cyclomaltodextrinase / maltogenic alpha-amylase / neopullulanase